MEFSNIPLVLLLRSTFNASRLDLISSGKQSDILSKKVSNVKQ